MAVDQFGNPLTEEELYRLMMQQQQAGLLPGLLGGPAVDTFSGMPFAAPSYGPFGGGIGQGAYQGTMGMGTPTILPGEETINITPVDPTLSGMAPVQELTGPTVNKFAPIGSDYTPQQLGTPIQDLLQQDIPSNVVPLDPTGGLAATDPSLQGITPMSMASTDLYSEAGVPMSNENLSFFGAAPVPTSPSMNTADYSQALADVGMAEVVNPVPSVPDIVAPETPAPYTGELDRYGLGGWTPEVPTSDNPTYEPGTIASDILDWTSDFMYDERKAASDALKNLTGITIPVVMSNRKEVEEKIIEKARTAPKGHLERIAEERAGPSPEEIEAIIEKAISAPTGNLERIAIARSKAADKRASDLEKQKKAAADKRAKARTAAKAAAKAEADFAATLDDSAMRGWKSLSAAERRAASTGYGRGGGFMGGDIGHDEGGYTGGDFSSGAGWE